MHHTTRLLSSSILLVCSILAPGAVAQDLYAGSADGTLLRGHPAAGDFAAAAEHSAPIRALAFRDGGALLVGDAASRVHRFDPTSGAMTELFESPVLLEAMVLHTGVQPGLYVGGEEGVLVRLDPESGAVLASIFIGAPVQALSVAINELVVGTEGALVSVDLTTGDVVEHSIPVRVNALALDDDVWVVSDGAGRVARVSRSTFQIETSFALGHEGAAVLLHTKQLVTAGADGSLLRVNRRDGTLAQSLSTDHDVRALALEPMLQPGQTYCYGDFCPCDNVDHEGGCTNSTGIGAMLRASGSASVTADDLFIASTELPRAKLALFVAGAQSNWILFGDGLLCTGGGAAGLLRFPVSNTGLSGSTTLGPGLVQHTHQHMPAPKHIVPGQTLNIQAWYRDLEGPCGTGLNLSNALTVTFLP